MSYEQGTDSALAVLNLVVAVYVVTRGRRWLGRTSPAIFALASYFFLRAIARFTEATGFEEVSGFEIDRLLDILLILTVLLLIATIEPIVRGIAAREDAARYRATEYDRARRHYVQVVRHRMMNPLTVIRGSALTLLDEPELERTTRDRLLDAIVEASNELEAVSLVPERRDDNERELDAVPRVPAEDRRRTTYPDGPVGPS
jgi:signal transduction histidine kinase